MKFFVCALLIAQAVLQITNAQCIRTVAGPLINSCVGPSAGPIVNPCSAPLLSAPVIAGPVIQSNSVAASLADTLSLLTVSSLLSDTLPLSQIGCGCGAPLMSLPIGGCGCGGGYGGYYY